MTNARLLRRASLACAALASTMWAASAIGQATVPPVAARGPHPVGCSNVEQDLSRVPPGETAEWYWRGVSLDQRSRYVTELLVDRDHSLVATFVAPADTALFGAWSGRTLVYAAIVCYPTTSANTRRDYTLPRGVVVPRMQRGGEPPILPASGRLPVLLYSHGYGGSPLSGSYLDAITAFASWGQVVVAPFHGDLRYSAFGPDNGGNEDLYAPIWDEFVAMQATRPLSLSAALDLVAVHPDWRDRIDLSRVGAFGISQGGETIMLAGGAALTYRLGTLDAKRVTLDGRIRAAVGYVPYLGIESIPAFGAGQQGVDGIALPYLALSGTDDRIAPIAVTRTAVERIAGQRGLVALNGQSHDLEPGTADDIVTWTLAFLGAWVDGDAAARAQLETMRDVAGGLDDAKVLYGPGAPNYQGLWWNAAESGWGINLAHQGDAVYLTWYTYDEHGGASWLALFANRAGADAFSGDIVEVRGSPYDVVPYDPAKKVATIVGKGTIGFTGASTGTFAYTAKGVSRSLAITRFSLGGPQPSCTYATVADLAAASNYQDLWWGGAAEDGWGLNLAHEGASIYATWYTFDSDGSPLWLSALMAPAGGSRWEGSLLRFSGPPFGPSFDPAAVASATVGSAALDIANGNALTWRYAVGDVNGAKALSRFQFMPPGATLCR